MSCTATRTGAKAEGGSPQDPDRATFTSMRLQRTTAAAVAPTPPECPPAAQNPSISSGVPKMLPALLGAARRGSSLQPSALAALVSTSSEALNAVAATATQSAPTPSRPPLAKPPLYKEFQIYRWNPDSDEKPKYVSYQARTERADAAPASSRHADRGYSHHPCLTTPPVAHVSGTESLHAVPAGGHQQLRAHDARRAAQSQG
jgi:hypothetical protein